MSTIHEINEGWQEFALQPTWAQLHKAQTEYDELRARVVALEVENAELKAKLTDKASLLRGCYAADHKQKQRIEELTAELERIKALPPVAWRSSMGHGVTLKETIADDQKVLTWDGKPMWQPLYALGSKTA